MGSRRRGRSPGAGWCIGFRTNLRYAPAGLAAVPVRELDLPLGIDMLHRRDETREVVVSVLGLAREPPTGGYRT